MPAVSNLSMVGFVALYAAIFVEFPGYAGFGVNQVITDAAGQAWQTRHMFQSLGLVSLFTLFFVIVLCALKLGTTGQLR